MNKTIVNRILYTAMFLLAGVIVLLACSRSRQSAMSFQLPLQFIGEYSQSGGEWQTYEETTKLSSYDGDLVLRGRFDPELPEGAQIRFYLNHIGMSIEMKGETIFESGIEMYPEMCGNSWIDWEMPALEADDCIEIHLHNPHNYGNVDAYNEFLHSVFINRENVLIDYLQQQNLPYRYLCAFVFVASIAMIGIGIGYQMLHLPKSGFLMTLGMLSLLVSAYMFFDTNDISMNRLIFNTYVRQLSIMFAAWILGTVMTEVLTEKRRKLAELAVYLLMAVDFACILVTFASGMRFYDAGIYWAVVQGMVSLVILVLGVLEGKKTEGTKRLFLFSGKLLLTALLLELVNACTNWWRSGIVFKAVFALAFVFWLIWAVWIVARNYQNSMRAEKLQMELKNSRIVLATSQIRTHFVFNVLNAVSGMCEYDPKKADETLVTFSRYLRKNINAMEEEQMEPFAKSMKHLEDYICLEQIRFGDRIRFEKQLDTENFMVPPLVLQPIVENAIVHGLLEKKEGGTIRLHTWTEDGSNMIQISDDGVGFDTEQQAGEDAVGIKNVRFRLRYMVNGTMEIKSRPQEGTTVTITIPKVRTETKDKGKRK